ncbi:MAG: hypothetical protein JJU00_11040 [Opitutales bacterium]|nr:hypothetical protein [Opitutales bacterium]
MRFLCLLSLFTGFVATGSLSANPWTHALAFNEAPYFVPAEPLDGEGRFHIAWAKFTVLPAVHPEDETRVYFQDSRQYPFHFDFARDHIPEFTGISRAEFDAQTLYNTGRRALSGAVLAILEYSGGPTGLVPVAAGIQFVSQDPLDREFVANSFYTVLSAFDDPDSIPSYYFPTFEQTEAARNDGEWLREQGIETASIQRWSSPEAVYAAGWAIGRLVEVAAAEIRAAYADGSLRPSDVLLTDRIPAEIPFVAGVITRYPATPNSHVALLARSWSIPFVHIGTDRFAMNSLIGTDVALSAVEPQRPRINLRPLDPDMDPALLEEILALKAPPDLRLPPMREAGTLWVHVDGARPADIDTIGGKAANFGLLREAIPDNAPLAIAVTFDLWKQFMAQPLPGRGHSLADEISARLAPFDSYPPDFAALNSELASIRRMIRSDTAFTAAQQEEILEVLGAHFEAHRRIRFRSSTNMEDSDHFAGAGLYDSYSGCLLDDLVPRTTGPSFCNPDRPSQQGVFRAIRRVFASFYNENAATERLRHGIDPESVGMAVLVHHSFPDEIELANGVAVIEPRYEGETVSSLRFTFVTQKGAEPVTNPTGDAVAEVVHTTAWGDHDPTSYHFTQHSNLLLLGDSSVMERNHDYRELAGLLRAVRRAFVEARPELRERPLEFEFKKLSPDGSLIVKQVRPLSLPPSPPDVRYLFAGSVELVPFQGEASTVSAIHRAKSRWNLALPSQRLEAEKSGEARFTSVRYERKAGSGIQTWTTPLETWPGYRASVETPAPFGNDRILRHSWNETVADLSATRTLAVTVPRRTEIPWLYPDELTFELLTDYPRHPAPWIQHLRWDPGSDLTQPVTERVLLVRTPRPAGPEEGDLARHRMVQYAGVTVDSRFYWPPNPLGFANYTAPLVAWETTRITGLTQQPFEVTAPFAQTYRPNHHNIGERFIFEPRLDPAVGPEVIAELEAQGIAALYVRYNSGGTGIQFINESGALTDPVEAYFGPVDYPLFSESTESEWLGRFFPAAFPFVKHSSMGWFYVCGGTPDGLWLTKVPSSGGWLWTNADLYPFFFSADENAWLYHWPAESNPGWWYSYPRQRWTQD